MTKSDSNRPRPKNGHGGARPGSGRKRGMVSAAKLTIAENAREHAGKALAALVAIAEDGEQPAAARVSAAVHILDRAFGKPVAPVEHDVTDGLTQLLRDVQGTAFPVASQRR